MKMAAAPYKSLQSLQAMQSSQCIQQNQKHNMRLRLSAYVCVLLLLVLLLLLVAAQAATPTWYRLLYTYQDRLHNQHTDEDEAEADAIAVDAHDTAAPKCGYAACPQGKDNMINVHIVPHTHNDVGWLKTVDQYYYGSKSMVQKAGVQYILDSVMKQLLHDPEKRFVYVETAYWWKWWNEQHDSLRHQIKRLVNTGQLEMIGGGWSMNDEAVTHYQSIIDQFTWGLRRLNDTFGTCGHPRVGWQIDPFGHSREMASLFAQMGYDGVFLGRVDYQDKIHRMASQKAEMIWRGSTNLGKSSELFTSILYNGYSPPGNFCFDVLCTDEPFIDNKHSPDYNVLHKVEAFIHYAKEQANAYATNNIIMTMGGDFTFQNAGMWYKNLDKLMRYVNERQENGSRVNVFYSTPSCYLKAVHNTTVLWTTKDDDFLPYASDPHAYWTGFYTSRPTIKYFERRGNNFLQVCKQLHTLSHLGAKDWVDLNVMREAMGVMQHHDAVTGTEKQAVADDYVRLLTVGMDECRNTAATAINKLLPKENQPPVELTHCPLLNISQCAPSEEATKMVVTVYNPLGQTTNMYVRLPVSGNAYSVQDPSGKSLTTQTVPIPQPVMNIPGRTSSAVHELVFLAANLPPLGFRSYYISERSSTVAVDEEDKLSLEPSDGDGAASGLMLENDMLKVELDRTTGMITTITAGGHSVHFNQTYLYYEAAAGNNKVFMNRSSGAYIFRPNTSDPVPVFPCCKPQVYSGDLLTEVQYNVSDWISQTVRMYKSDNHLELDWMVGPIPVNDNIGKEVISHFQTDLVTNGVFYTDSNGREMQLRQRNHRATWPLTIAEPVAGNYYPVTTRMVLKDKTSGMEAAVITDRTQGGTSLHDGQMELMVHRRLLNDDAFGVQEALNETAYGRGLVARGRHYIMVGESKPRSGPFLAAQQRLLAQRVALQPWIFVTPADQFSFEQWVASYHMEYYGMTRELPPNVHILTLEPWKASTILLRLEHIIEGKDDPELSKPVTVNLQNLFTAFTVKSARETTLAANQWLSDSKRLEWKMESNDISYGSRGRRKHDRTNMFAEDILSVTLKPMQIRTFVLTVE